MPQSNRVETSRRVGRIHRLNLGVNLLMAGGKVSIGLLSGSGALVADGLNSTSDLFSNFLSWLGHRVSERPADEDHHYGHANAEAVAAVAIGVIILVTGVLVVWGTFYAETVAHRGGWGWAALVAAGVSTVVSVWLSAVTLRVGRWARSPALMALGRDKRADSLTSFLVIVGISGSLGGLTWIEPVVTGIVGVWICVMGVQSISEGTDILMGRVSDPTLRAEIETVVSSVAGTECVRDVRIHPLGSTYRAELTICVNGALTVERGHEIAQEVETRVTQDLDGVVHVHVHVDPS